jgi:hypothetical protein
LTKTAYLAALTAALTLSIGSLAVSATAQALSGIVTNGTTNKPAAGDEVILINLANGMEVAASTKTDFAGKFSFKLPDQTSKDGASPAPHLIRAVHQGVTYHQLAPPGTNNVEVKVYDVSKKVDGLSLTADVIRFQADANSLDAMRLFAVDNSSSITQMNDHNFEFYLPAGAKIQQVQAKAPNGQPISAEAVPQAEKNRYAINFPLRPGETQFQLEFTLPYSGSLKVDPKPLYPAEHFVVMLPKSMHFAPANSATFKSMQDPNEADTIVQVAQQTRVGQQLGFTITGTGTISDQQAGGTAGEAGAPGAEAQGGPMNGNPQAESTRPGGGLGAPIDAPDPLEKYRWPIIGGFVVLLGLGGWVATKRQGAVSAASGASAAGGAGVAPGPLVAPVTGPGAAKLSGASARPVPANSSGATTATTSAADAATPKSAMLLEALKEELFQLEVERQQGQISAEEYDKAKAALDQTLDRALKRHS